MKTLLTACAFASLLSGCLAQKKNGPTLLELNQGEAITAPPTITLKMNQYRPAAGRSFKEIFVSNFSMRCRMGTCEESTSGDGLTDSEKIRATEYNFSTGSTHTKGEEHISDLLLFLLGVTAPYQDNIHCSDKNSTAGDIITYGGFTFGLRNCERRYLGLNTALFDFDNDGIPDYLELRCGLNPKNKMDAAISTSGDRLSNLEKCKRNIAVDESADSNANQLFAYQYQTRLESDGSKSITTGNIPVRNNRQNLIAFYLIEVEARTGKAFLFTAYALITPSSRAPVYQFNWWGGPGSQTNAHTNQRIEFP